MKDEKKQIRIAYADMWTGFLPDVFPLERILKKRFDLIHDEKNPDLVICGVFGHTCLRYDCIRVQLIGEAVSPDFNIYDYAIGFDDMQYENRYLRMPLYMFDTDAVKQASEKHLLGDAYYKCKKRFCNFVVSNPNAMPQREEFFKLLSKEKKVDSAGRYLNNMPNGETCSDLVEFRRPYRFTLAFENSIMNGYITEKILYAFAAGTVPIYFGGNGVEKEFNSKAFVDVSKFSSLEECVKYVISLDENEEEYLKMCREPAFVDGLNLDFEERLLTFFEKIIDGGSNCFQRTSKKTLYGRIYEAQLLNLMPHDKTVKSFLKRLFKKRRCDAC